MNYVMLLNLVAAKDPINMAGMIAGNNLREDLPLADWNQLQTNEQQIIDVRSPAEFSSGHIPGAVNIPLEEMRQRIEELSPDKEVWFDLRGRAACLLCV